MHDLSRAVAFAVDALPPLAQRTYRLLSFEALEELSADRVHRIRVDRVLDLLDIEDVATLRRVLLDLVATPVRGETWGAQLLVAVSLEDGDLLYEYTSWIAEGIAESPGLVLGYA